MEPTNEEIMDRLSDLEGKVDKIFCMLEQATGAWLLIKICASVAVGIAAISVAIHGVFK